MIMRFSVYGVEKGAVFITKREEVEYQFCGKTYLNMSYW